MSVDVRHIESRRFLKCKRVFWHRPQKVCRSLGIFCEGSLVWVCGAMSGGHNVISECEVRYVLPELHNGSRHITANYGTRLAAGSIDVYESHLISEVIFGD